MLKRIILFVFMLSALALIALAPMQAGPTGVHGAKLQEATVVVTVVIDTPPPAARSAPPAGALSASTMIIFGLLVVLGLAVVIGGMALMRPRE